jgi:hypothetical protein
LLRMISDALVRACATWPAASWNRSSFHSVRDPVHTGEATTSLTGVSVNRCALAEGSSLHAASQNETSGSLSNFLRIVKAAARSLT